MALGLKFKIFVGFCDLDCKAWRIEIQDNLSEQVFFK